MTFRVAIVTEDPSDDRYIVKPLIERMLEVVGKPRARVLVIENPRISGYEHAKQMLEGPILDRYASDQLILFLPDSDLRDRSGEFERLERLATSRNATLVCSAAVPEVEAWLLAGHMERIDTRWTDLRSHPHLKETIFEPFLRQHGDFGAGRGRERLMRETLRNYRGLLTLCDELAHLERRVREVVARSTDD